MAIRDGLELQKRISVELPIVVKITLVGVGGFRIHRRQSEVKDMSCAFFGNLIGGPTFIVDDYSTPLDEIVRPIFDKIWQEGGYPRCLNYDESGKRLPFSE